MQPGRGYRTHYGAILTGKSSLGAGLPPARIPGRRKGLGEGGVGWGVKGFGVFNSRLKTPRNKTKQKESTLFPRDKKVLCALSRLANELLYPLV